MVGTGAVARVHKLCDAPSVLLLEEAHKCMAVIEKGSQFFLCLLLRKIRGRNRYCKPERDGFEGRMRPFVSAELVPCRPTGTGEFLGSPGEMTPSPDFRSIFCFIDYICTDITICYT